MILNPATVKRSLAKSGTDAEVRGWLAQAITGPKTITMRDVVELVGRLSLQYWRPNFSPEQAKLLFQDFAQDLAGLTREELAQACLEWRRDPENRFFPTSGQLRGVADHILRRRARDRAAAERLLAILDTPEEGTDAPVSRRSSADILAARRPAPPQHGDARALIDDLAERLKV